MINEKRFIRFDWSRTLDNSFDNVWKTTIEVLWNAGIPMLSGALIIIHNQPLWSILGLLAAYLELKIDRKSGVSLEGKK